MREIKFRVWQKSVGEFVNIPQEKHEEKCFGVGWLALDLDGTLIYQTKTTYTPVEDPDDFIVQQYTGLKDKNGVEIYEGDYVHRADGYIGAVEYGRVLHSNTGKAYVGFYLRKDENNYTHIDGTLEVVGNIFEGVDK